MLGKTRGRGGPRGEELIYPRGEPRADWRRLGARAMVVGGTLLVPILVGVEARKALSGDA